MGPLARHGCPARGQAPWRRACLHCRRGSPIALPTTAGRAASAAAGVRGPADSSGTIRRDPSGDIGAHSPMLVPRAYHAVVSRHRRLASVADGTARAFSSRNNDVDGWWALGLLLAQAPPSGEVTLDLIAGVVHPEATDPMLAALGPAWGRYLSWTLDRHGLSPGSVKFAGLSLRFDLSTQVPSWIDGARDHPFLCTVTIEDDGGHLYKRQTAGHCARPRDFAGASPMRSGPPHDDVGRVHQRMAAKPARAIE